MTDDAKAAAFQQRLLERVAALPGVESFAQASKIPLSPGRHQTMFRIPGSDQWHEVNVNTVSPSYFSLIAIPIIRGRTFTAAELDDPSRGVIITEATARQYWPGDDPIGRTLVMSQGENREVTLEIVGVAKDAQVSQVAATDSNYLYLARNPERAARTPSARAKSAGFRGAGGSRPLGDAGARCRSRRTTSTGWKRISNSGAPVRVWSPACQDR